MTMAEADRRNSETIAAMGLGDALARRWADINEKYLAAVERSSDVVSSYGSMSKVLRMFMQSSVLGLGAYLVIRQELTAGSMIAASIMMGRALAPIEVALATWKQLAAARQGIARLRETLASTASSSLPSVVLPRPRRELSVRDLTVAAPGTERTIVANVSFSLPAGTGLAVLGASASGKTSLTKALVGVWPAIGGAVRLDGAALHQWHHDDLGRHIGYLPQEVALFEGTVAENIARFDDGAGSDTILRAAEVSGAHDMIVQLPDGYSTRIGEGGMSLSAGQRQRLGLARAVFGDPFLVVLDEPNANLDAGGEAALTRAIECLRNQGRIVIVVSHRPSSLSALNLASVMYDGRMIAFGPRDEIFARVAGSARRQATITPIQTKAGISSHAGAAS